MIVRNTSSYPTEEVKKLVAFAAKGFNDSKVCINVKNNSRSYAGRAYRGIPSVSNAPSSSDYLVVVRIGKPDKFPCDDYYSHKKYKRLTPFSMDTWQEALVTVTAHELTHIQQFKRRRPCSEVEASKKAYKKLLEFRGITL